MKIFIVSKYGSSQDMANKLLQEGHDTSMFIRDRTARSINPYRYLISNPVGETLQADLFIIEDSMSGQFADRARSLNKSVIGGGILSDKLTKDADYHNRVLNGCGFKPSKPETRGMPITLGGWFNGEEFLRPYFLGVRYQRVGAGDVGHKTRGMGIAGQYKMKGNIFSLLRKTETLLKTSKYQGFVTLQLLINNDFAHVEQMELGLGFPTISAIVNLHNVLGNFLIKLTNKDIKQIPVQPDKVVVGVVWLQNVDQATICPNILCRTGNTLEEASATVYKDIKNVCNENTYYRVDIGVNYTNYLKSLKKWDWI